MYQFYQFPFLRPSPQSLKAALSAVVDVSLEAATANSLILNNKVCTSARACSPVSTADCASFAFLKACC